MNNMHLEFVLHASLGLDKLKRKNVTDLIVCQMVTQHATISNFFLIKVQTQYCKSSTEKNVLCIIINHLFLFLKYERKANR